MNEHSQTFNGKQLIFTIDFYWTFSAHDFTHYCSNIYRTVICIRIHIRELFSHVPSPHLSGFLQST